MTSHLAGGGDDEVPVGHRRPARVVVERFGGDERPCPASRRAPTARGRQVVATTVVPSVSSRLSREPGRGGGDVEHDVRPSASAGSAPARSRCRTSAHSSAASVGASRVSRSRDRQRGGERRPPTSGQPRTTPLWLNSHAPLGERAPPPPR